MCHYNETGLLLDKQCLTNTICFEQYTNLCDDNENSDVRDQCICNTCRAEPESSDA